MESLFDKVKEYALNFFVRRKLGIQVKDITPKALKFHTLTLDVVISEMTYHWQFEYSFSRMVLEDDFYTVMENACQQWLHSYRTTKDIETTKTAFNNLSKFAQQRLWHVYRGYDTFELHERDLYRELADSDLIVNISLLPLPSEAYWYRVVRLSSSAHRLLHSFDSASEKGKET